MNWTTIAIALLLTIAPTVAAASECALEIARVNANLTSDARVTRAEFKKAKDLRDRAAALCTAGDVNGALALLAEAKTILQVK